MVKGLSRAHKTDGGLNRYPRNDLAEVPIVVCIGKSVRLDEFVAEAWLASFSHASFAGIIGF